MTRRTIQLHPAALEEVEAATDWYAERSHRAAERFLNELRQAIEQVSEHRESPPGERTPHGVRDYRTK